MWKFTGATHLTAPASEFARAYSAIASRPLTKPGSKAEATKRRKPLLLFSGGLLGGFSPLGGGPGLRPALALGIAAPLLQLLPDDLALERLVAEIGALGERPVFPALEGGQPGAHRRRGTAVPAHPGKRDGAKTLMGGVEVDLGVLLQQILLGFIAGAVRLRHRHAALVENRDRGFLPHLGILDREFRAPYGADRGGGAHLQLVLLVQEMLYLRHQGADVKGEDRVFHHQFGDLQFGVAP